MFDKARSELSPLISDLHGGAAELLQLFRDGGRQPYEHGTVEEAREIYRATSQRFTFPLEPDVATRDTVIPLTDREIPIRVFNPGGFDQPGPLLVFFHGGGWVIGDLETHDATCRRLSALIQAVVVAVDYRRAPEHPFPAAAEDAIDATRWIAAHAGLLGGDPSRICLAGDSAGATLSLVAALAWRGTIALRALGLFYPLGDFSQDAPSMSEFASGYPLTGATMHWFRDLYLGDIAHAMDIRASPVRTQHFDGLPATYILSVGHDPLRDDTIALAARLADSSTPTVHRHLPDQIHGFLTFGGLIEEAGDELKRFARFLKAVPSDNA